MTGNCDEQEARFDIYCPLCEAKDTPQDQEPCDTCLGSPTNLYSIKPIKFKEKKR